VPLANTTSAARNSSMVLKVHAQTPGGRFGGLEHGGPPQSPDAPFALAKQGSRPAKRDRRRQSKRPSWSIHFLAAGDAERDASDV
jgi:hypothetical protein